MVQHAALYPVIALGLPFGGPSVVIGSANVLISPLGAALLGLALNEAAYMAKIIRSGISSVDKGQHDAARALAISDLLYSAQIIYSFNYQTIPLLIVASLWYLLMTTVLSYFQNKLERRYGRGFDTATRLVRRPKRRKAS